MFRNLITTQKAQKGDERGIAGNVRITSHNATPKLSLYLPALFVIVLACIPVLTRNPVFLQIMILIMWYAYLTCSWNIVGGFAGQLSFAHPAFAGLGAYVSTLLFMYCGLTPWLGMLVGGLFAVLIVITIGYPCFKLRGAYFAITSIALAEVLRIAVENTDELFGIKIGGPMGLLVPLRGHSPLYMQFTTKEHYYYVILVMMLFGLFVTYRITKSKMGYYLAAIRNDVDAALALGVNVTKYRLLAAAISAFLAALGGTFYAQFVLYIHPSGIMGQYLAFELVFIAIVGGRGTFIGPLLGAFTLVPLSELSRIYLGGGYSGVHLLVYGFLVMLVILFMPRGLSAPAENIYLALERRLRPAWALERGDTDAAAKR